MLFLCVLSLYCKDVFTVTSNKYSKNNKKATAFPPLLIHIGRS